MYEIGIIGNCQTTALIHKRGSLQWLCWPRPDSPPLFGQLIDGDGGEFTIEGASYRQSSQRYLSNTNILVTTIETSDGVFEIVDFCPRFEQYGRLFRPNELFRIVRPIKGTPHVRVTCTPISGWDKQRLPSTQGNSHLRFERGNDFARLLTTMSMTHLIDGNPVPLTEPIYFALSWNHAIEEDLARVANDFLTNTERYWRTWVKHCTIPTEFQSETIRSALVLKLHCFEDTGAILAASTTSLPEEVGAVRNWDYRFCWLRDSYFVLTAFHRLGHFEEMEGFLKFLLGIAYREENLRPVYSIDGGIPLPEHLHTNWSGFEQSQPVRSNNEAASHIQNDSYGEMILALAPIFLDERFNHLRTPDHEDLIAHLAQKCARSLEVPDAGLWELRGKWRVHSFTDLMCWAGLQQAERFGRAGYLAKSLPEIPGWLTRAKIAVEKSVVDGSLRNGPTDKSFNAAHMQIAALRYPDSKLVERTVEETAKQLTVSRDGEFSPFLYRYRFEDDFGTPQSAFVCCSFWWAQALGQIGKKAEGRLVLEKTLEAANSLGLFAEHFDLKERRQLGNFPQAYSHVGLINSAFSCSPPWSEVL